MPVTEGGQIKILEEKKDTDESNNNAVEIESLVALISYCCIY